MKSVLKEVNMKAIKFLRAVIVLAGILLSACAPAANSAAPNSAGGGKVQPEVIFTGAIESMNGNQWVINGQAVTVDESVLRDGPFSVGDTVKVEARVAADGSVMAQRVELPSAQDILEAGTSAPTAAPASAPTQAPGFDDNNANEAVGTVDAITDTSITIAGQTYTFAPGAEIKGTITAGASVKLHFVTNADGTLSVREVEIADPTQIEDNHSGDDGSNHDVNDDHGGASNIGDDGSNHDANDDHSGGSNSDGDDN
jgi:hypothetical protein